jgi:1-acyl-sn-glycerol-3-phosphate acyltransferase
VLVLVDRIVGVRVFFLIDWLHRLSLLLFFLLFVGVDTRDEEPIPVVLNVLDVRSW